MNIPTDELLSVARKVLAGEMTRDEVSELPLPHMAYVGITMMLARWEKYGNSGSLVVQGGLGSYLKELVFIGTSHDKKSFLEDKAQLSATDILDVAGSLGLFEKGGEAGYRWLALSPPADLQLLVDSHRTNPAVQEFLDEVAAGPKRRDRWRAQAHEEYMKEMREFDASYFITQFEEEHGTAGLDALRTQLEKRMWW